MREELPDRAEAELEEFEQHRPETPHGELSTPVGEPDPTEWPDPYEQREDPRDPRSPDRHTIPGALSTSEPHPDQDIEAGDRANPPQRDRLDD